MTNIDNEVQPEFSKNNILEDIENTQVKDMLDAKKMKIIMKKFKNCAEIRHSNHLTKHVKGVKKLYEIFRKFIKDSLEFNKRLNDYSLNISFLAECFKDNNCSEKDILVLSNDLLKESMENYRLAEELEKRLIVDEEVGGGFMKELKNFIDRIFYGKRDSGIVNELKKIRSSLENHIRDIKSKIKSDEEALISYEGSEFYNLYIGVLLRVAISLDNAKEWVNGEKVTKEKSYAEGVMNKKETRLVKEKEAISDQLSKDQNELDTLNLFYDNLSTIIKGISKIKAFWGMQIESIKDFIKNLDQFRGGQNIQRKRIVYILERKWKNVERYCRIYNEAMIDVLVNAEV